MRAQSEFLLDYQEQTGNFSKSLDQSFSRVKVLNDGDADLLLTVGTFTDIKIKAGETLDFGLDRTKSYSVETTSTFRVFVFY